MRSRRLSLARSASRYRDAGWHRAAPAGPRTRSGSTILRLTRSWRERVESAQARLAAADAIIDAVPDPLILLDQRRRIVRANAAAGEFVGALLPLPDLAAALRNPAVLTAADAALRGEAARVVEFTLTVPVERQLRARFARIARASPDAAVAGADVARHHRIEARRTVARRLYRQCEP